MSPSDTRTFVGMLEDGAFEKCAAFKLLKKQVRYLPLGLSRQRRQTDMQRLERFLESCFDDAAMGEDKWIRDLEKLGYSNEEMARLLYESNFDSPWIYYKPTAGIKTTSVSVGDHQPSCPYEFLEWAGGRRPQRPQQYNKPPHPGLSEVKNRIIEHFCGLGGVNPLLLDDTDVKVEFENQNTRALVTLYRLAAEPKDLTRGVRQLHAALGHAQEAGLCCCSFTLLTRSRAAHDSGLDIRLISFTLSEIRTYLELIEWPGAFLSDIQSLVQRIFPDAPLPGDTFIERTFIPNLAPLVLQILSAGLLSYKQAHVGAVRPFFLDTSLDEICLLGTSETENSNAHSVKAQLVELSCFSEVTKGPVLVFSPSWAEGGQWSPQPDQKFNIRGTPEAILDTWGPGGLISRSDTQEHYVALKIGSDYIYASNTSSKPAMYHFGQELNLADESPGLSPGVEIVVGNLVQVNVACEKVEEDCWTYSSENHQLEEIRSHGPYWKLHQRQIALQGGLPYNLPRGLCPGEEARDSREGLGALLRRGRQAYVARATSHVSRPPLRR